MIFMHDTMSEKRGSFCFRGSLTAKSNKALNNNVIKDFWLGHTFRLSEISFETIDDLFVKIGDAEVLDSSGYSYAINVTPDGASVSADSEKNLIRGFMTLIDLIKISPNGDYLTIGCGEIKESPSIEKQMIHFCVFHGCTLWQIERFVRLCGVLKYTHIILEFWGMYKYDCLKELSWEEGFTKEQLAPIIKTANTLGIEIIPMINHWGHASSARSCRGKHVVLNQNPSLQYLFNENGWCWDFKNPKTLNLLREMRKELCDLCGDGEYFHIGCDEASGFDFSEENMTEICKYINRISAELKEQGRHTLMWGDMILSRHPDYEINMNYSANCPDAECEKYVLNALSKDIIIADWQYCVKKAPVETALTLKAAGFDVMLCPWDWDGGKSIRACCETVVQHELFGIIHTTWHTLNIGMPEVTSAAQLCVNVNSKTTENDLKTAALLRKVYFTSEYEKAGWSLKEVEF